MTQPNALGSGLVLVLNSGSSSVKFALLDPGSGRRVMDGMAEKVGTTEAVLRTRRYPSAAITEPIGDCSFQAIISRILEYLPEAGPGTAADKPAAVVGVGHRIAHGESGSPPRSWWMTK